MGADRPGAAAGWQEEGRDLWRRLVRPDRHALLLDRDLLADLDAYGLSGLLREREGWLHPAVPWELLLDDYLLPEVLFHYAALLRLGVLPVLEAAAARPPEPDGCGRCGACCLSMAFTIETRAADVRRLRAFLRAPGVGMTPRRAAVLAGSLARAWCGARRVGAGEGMLLACPLLARAGKGAAACAAYAARPEVCRGFSRAQCERFLEERRRWKERRRATAAGE
ncbi:hypothetical protein HCU62_00660 [Dissulfurirhabdus thermomarina]|nr:hypothetical protein [Dissulfurirhabdus thermomarina]